MAPAVTPLITSDGAAQGLELLLDTAMRRDLELATYASEPVHADSDDETDSESLITDAFRCGDCPSVFLKMTIFQKQNSIPYGIRWQITPLLGRTWKDEGNLPLNRKMCSSCSWQP